MPGLSIHVVDVSRGVMAAGMRVVVRVLANGPASVLADGMIGASGTLDAPQLAGVLARGHYEADFHVADYYRAARVSLPEKPFLDVVTYRFGIDDPAQHYHLPLKCTPWGYSCFRGGA
jgi:5-hydroxyisourate hydrolase